MNLDRSEACLLGSSGYRFSVRADRESSEEAVLPKVSIPLYDARVGLEWTHPASGARIMKIKIWSRFLAESWGLEIVLLEDSASLVFAEVSL